MDLIATASDLHPHPTGFVRWALALLLAITASVAVAADLTMGEGVVVKFGATGQLVVRDRLIPGPGVVLTSETDDNAVGQTGSAPQVPHAGDWLGLRIEKSAAVFGLSALNELSIRYGGGSVGSEPGAALTVRGWSPGFRFLHITDSTLGLRLQDGAAPVIEGGSFLRNLTGIEAESQSSPAIGGSQFAGNSLYAIHNQAPATTIAARGNWWGHATGPRDPVANPEGQGDAVSLGVDFAGFLSLAPLINPTVRLAAPASYFEQHAVTLDLGCVNAVEYRIAENYAFGTRAFQPMTDGRAEVLYQTSEGDGRKTITVQFRDANGVEALATLAGGVLIDSAPPRLVLTTPADGSYIRQSIVLEAEASDEAGVSQVRFFLDGTLLATRAAAPYTTPWNTDTLGDGTYTVKAVATDIAGRTSEQSATVQYSRAPPPPDTDGPVLSNITANGVLLANGASFARNASLGFGAADRSGVARIEVLLDGTAITSATGSGTYTAALNLDGVANGSHTLTLRAVDSLGNVSTTGFAIVVAHVPPPAPVLNQPASGTLTRYTSVQVAGSAQAGSSVQLRVNGQPAGAPLVVGSDGRFSGTLTLTSGSNQIQATATDAYGTGPLSNTLSVTVDTSVPTSPANLTVWAQAAGKLRLAWTRSTDPSAVGYDLYRAAAAFTDLAGAAKVNTSLLTGTTYDDLPLHDGVWSYRVVAVNAAGTPSEPSNLATATADSAAPEALSIVYAPQGKTDPATGRVGQGRVDLTLTLSEPVAATPYLAIVPQGGAPKTVELTAAGDSTYTGSFLIDANTPSGVANALFSARDAVGNRGTEIGTGATLSIDTAGPSLSGIALDPESPIASDGSTTVDAVFTLTEAPKATPEIKLQLSGAGREPITLAGLEADGPTTWRGSFTLPADAGVAGPETLSFGFRAVDDMDNVSTKVLASNRFQVYHGALPPLAVPNAFTAVAQPAGKVKLAWQAVEGAAAYQLYRQGPGDAGLEPLTRASGNQVIDQTPDDGSYRYAVASVRKANGDEALSGQSPPVTVIASATAPSAPRSFALQLTGQGIVATWQPPATGTVASYNLYRASGTGISGVSGLTPLKTGIKQPPALDPSPSPIQGAYAVTALDAAGNESRVSNSQYLNASLLPASQVTIEQTGNLPPVLSWQAPNGNLAGYKVYADLGADAVRTPLTAQPITALSYTDGGYVDGDRLYTLATVDANGVEMPRSLLLPRLAARIASGLPLQRGVMNQLQVEITNHSSVRLDNVKAVVRLPIDKTATQFKEHPSQSFSLDAGQTRQAAVVVGGYDGLPATAEAEVRVEIAPHEGELVKIARTQPAEAIDGALVVGMATDAFTRGGTGTLKLSIENTSDVEVELLTATSNGQGPSTELRFKLLDADGNVLATQPYRQTLGANVVTLTNGMTVARIPAHSSYVSDAFTLTVPASSPDSLRVKLEVDKLRYHSGQPDEVTITGRGSEKTVSLLDTAYRGDVTGASPARSFGDQPIVITGRALERSSGTPLPNTRLKLVLNQQGFERVFDVLTDGSGAFSYSFTPTATDAGLFKVSAVHPDVTDRPEQTTFTISRVTVGPTPYKLDIPKNYPFSIPFVAKAGPGTTATNLRFTLNAASQPTGQLPAGVTAQLPAAGSLAERQTLGLPVVFSADNSAQPSGALILDLLSDEQPAALGQVRVDYTLSAAKPYLTSTPSFVETGLAQGGSVVESVTVKNQGLQDALNLQFSLAKADGSPAPAWASIASQAGGTLAIGAQRIVDLAFSPPAGTAEGVYEFKLKVSGDNLPEQFLNVYVSLTQSGQGSVLFKASDIYTATLGKDGQLIPGLAGAKVTVQNEDVVSVTRDLVTDSLGEAFFQNLPAGRYKFRATATNHQELGGRFQIKPGVTFNQPLFLNYNLITVEWSVREITIEDRYEIILNATFETDVPAAVVVLQPASINLPKMNVGEVFYGELSLTNYGLIRADNVRQQVPRSDAFFRYEFLTEVPTTLEAKQRVTIPYRIVALQSLDSTTSGTATGGGCYSYSNTTSVSCTFVCANGGQSQCGSATSWYAVSNGSCPAGGGSGGGGGGGGGFAGGGGFGGPGGSAVHLKGKKCVFIPKGGGPQCQ